MTAGTCTCKQLYKTFVLETESARNWESWACMGTSLDLELWSVGERKGGGGGGGRSRSRQMGEGEREKEREQQTVYILHPVLCLLREY